MRAEESYRKRNRTSRDQPSMSGGGQHFSRPHRENTPQTWEGFCTASGAPLPHQPPTVFGNESSTHSKPNGNSYFSQYLPIFRDKAMTARASVCAVEMSSNDSSLGDMDEESLLRAFEIENFHDQVDPIRNIPQHPSRQRPPLSDVQTVIRFRRIQPKDRAQIQALHEEWFPVEYQQEFYDDLCNYERMCHSGHKLYTMVAVISKNDTATPSTPHSTTPTDDTSDEQVVACLVGCVLSAHKLNDDSRQLLVPNWPHRHSKLFYIMTLGTVSAYRHLGLATRLVEQVMESVVNRDKEMGTIYLHVITFNDAAIRFYEDRLGFWKVQEIADYYSIDGEPYNCYLYARYFHGNRGHLDLFKVVSRWITTLWSSLSNLITSRGYFSEQERIQY